MILAATMEETESSAIVGPVTRTGGLVDIDTDLLS